MDALRKTLPTAEEYLAVEREIEGRNEYYQGQIYAMSGAGLDHNRICGNLSGEIREQLKDRPCEAFASEMKVRIEVADCFFYPDISGLCGPMEFHDGRKDIYLNPVFVIEILSDSTEAYDRGKKFLAYQSLASLKEYVMVSQIAATVEIYRREGEHWTYEQVSGKGRSLVLASVGCEIPFSEIYRNVDFKDGE